MVDLLKIVYDRISTNPEIRALMYGAAIERTPTLANIKTLTKPVIVIGSAGDPDSLGFHGAATDPIIELNIWGYGYDHIKVGYTLGQHLDRAMLEPFFTSSTPPVQVTGRFRPFVGWQMISESSDRDVIHLQNRYGSRYWPQTRLELFT